MTDRAASPQNTINITYGAGYLKAREKKADFEHRRLLFIL
jgi:hypothetical protein